MVRRDSEQSLAEKWGATGGSRTRRAPVRTPPPTPSPKRRCPHVPEEQEMPQQDNTDALQQEIEPNQPAVDQEQEDASPTMIPSDGPSDPTATEAPTEAPQESASTPTGEDVPAHGMGRRSTVTLPNPTPSGRIWTEQKVRKFLDSIETARSSRTAKTILTKKGSNPIAISGVDLFQVANRMYLEEITLTQRCPPTFHRKRSHIPSIWLLVQKSLFTKKSLHG